MNKFVKTLLAATLAFAATTANAKTYFLSESNTFADGVNYVQVDVTENSGALDFLVKALTPSNWGIDKFFFNVDSSTVAISNVSAGWTTVTNPSSFNVSEFGIFNDQEKTQSGDALSTLAFTVNGSDPLTLSNLAANAEGWIFAAHQKCQGTSCSSIQGISSHFVAGPSTVPMPAAAWLFGSALIGFIGWSNRRRV